MKSQIILGLVLSLWIFISPVYAQKIDEPIGGQSNRSLSVANLTYQLKYHRAFESALWAMPAVAIYRLRKAAFSSEIGLDNNVIAASPSVAGPSKELLTANSSTTYITAFTDLKKGPVVVKIPASGEEGTLYGQVVDHWQRTIADVGPSGLDAGKGGNYLFTAKDYNEEIPSGYIHVPSSSYRIAFVFRSIRLKGKTEEDAFNYAKRLKMYYLSDGEPSQQKFVDSKEKRYSTLPLYDHRYFQDIYDVFTYENIEDADKYMMGMLKYLGIEKGKPFSPDSLTINAMENAMGDLYIHIQQQWEKHAYEARLWKDRFYTSLMLADENNSFSYDYGNYIDIDARVAQWASGTLLPTKLSKRPATEYLAAIADHKGEPLKAGETYKVTVPADMPVKQFWALTVYDRATFAFIYNDLNRTTLSSYDLKKMQKNKDGTVTLYIGPNPPVNLESNWIPTRGKRPLPTFRFYGPTEELYDGSFKMPDLKKM